MKVTTITTKRVLFSRALGLVLALGLGACNDLDEYNPSNATADTVWSTPEGFVTVVNGAYSEQRSWYGKEDGEFMSESGTDLWFNRDKNTYAGQLTQYAGLTPLQGNPNRAAWTALWKSINLCNAGINRINGAGFTSAQDKNQREGELRFLRAFYYWHVVETWGGVMLRTQETQEPVLTATRSSVEDFYNLIISDLEFAAANLPVSWGNEYSRATNKAAMGFLARAYLSRAYYSTGGDAQTYFTKARDMANSIITRKGELKVDLSPSYADLFNPVNNKKQGRDGGEALYVVSNSTNQSLNYDDQGNRLFQVFQTPYNGKPGLEQSVVYGYENNRRLMPTLTLLDLYDATKDSRYESSFQEVWLANKAYTWTAADARTYGKDASLVGKQLRVGDTALVITKRALPNKNLRTYVVYDRNDVYLSNRTIRDGLNFVTLKKFFDPNRSAPNVQAGTNDVMVMRLAEMYLISAEAEFQLGNRPAAATMINVLRTRAARKTPVNQTTAMQITAADVTLDFILDERAREFAGENIRWFDVKRMKGVRSGNDFASYITQRNPDITQVQPFHVLRPIRQEELNSLTNGAEFGQNPGY
ncbi:RagB/SusD family nutrient uptake outer membrane protein [Hymenobacter sp. GOD-10R]|uniref:RagB/SusD family nutrient uptake outer membrane protein n=1 Tax=Hymenobacter sp. GOD-10R TaxID=3093922 RepID=UPI002D788FCF|nr:RagB/SusD family nutrient uptake outer membrane protein [Hymenobacter sp. GOD-10R]WRQ28427.1 RagB/SusD family nutrient uptake outer membrane protein [Hymenobacter sp. GOD-10R]